MEIINGENIQLRCDYLIGTKRDLEFNPLLRSVEDDKKIDIESMRKTLVVCDLCRIFCYSHLLLRRDFVEKMKLIGNSFELYLHNSDLNFTEKYLELFKEISNLKHIYTQNMEVKDSRVSPLPIGIANTMWPHGNIELLKKYMLNVEKRKTNHIFFNFTVSTNKGKRQACKEIMEEKGIVWIGKMKNQEDYLKNLSSYRFAICPEGNGNDTHRFWECLYLKVVPICKKNKLVEHYANIFPVVVLKEWSDLNIASLNYDTYSWKNYSKLDLNSVIEKEAIDVTNVYSDPQQENIFDIVIPIGPNDTEKVKNQIPYTKRNVIGYRNIYLICFDANTKIEGCVTINENTFPFNIKTVESMHSKSWRNGWYLQQLLKLYAGFVIPGILDTYLVIDSDTFFTKPTTFIKDNKCCYNYGRENHGPYFSHMGLLHNSLKRVDSKKSGICHHMIFEKSKMKKLFKLVEECHENKPFYEIFLEKVNKKFHKNGSGASEYEIYFNYLLIYHKDEIIVRELRWKNSKSLDDSMDYVSVHWHLGFSNLNQRQKMIDESEEKRRKVA